ncbi:MAG: CAP domain-containing protein [Rivularia sp. (in: cyanobacteria)]
MAKLTTKIGLLATVLVMSNLNIPQAEASVRSQVIQLVNQVRSRGAVCGGQTFVRAGALSANTRLTNAAQYHSQDMANTRRMSHTGSNGSSMAQRVKQAGYRYRTIGENVGVGQTSASSIVRGWLNSPGHCANLMKPNFNEAGVGVARGRDGQLYWTMVYGRRR